MPPASSKVELLESSLIVAKNTNSLLEKQVDDLQQYLA